MTVLRWQEWAHRTSNHKKNYTFLVHLQLWCGKGYGFGAPRRFGGRSPFFCFLNRFFGGFVFFWHFMVRKVVLGGRNQFWRKNRFHGGCTEVPRRFHGGSTEVSGPTPKNSCNLRRNPHIPQNALNSQAFSGAPRVRPNVGCEPPFSNHVGCVSCRVKLWTPS